MSTRSFMSSSGNVLLIMGIMIFEKSPTTGGLGRALTTGDKTDPAIVPKMVLNNLRLFIIL
jgi:hypothetical protein